MEEYLAAIDEYGNGFVTIDVTRYYYQGCYYVKGVRTVVRTGKSKILFNMPESVIGEVAELLCRRNKKVGVA